MKHDRRGGQLRSRDGRQAERHGRRGAEPRPAAPQDRSLLVGRNSLREVLRYSPERIAKVYAVERWGSEQSDYQEIVEMLRAKGIPVEPKASDELYALTGTEAHQSFAAELKPRIPLDLKTLIERESAREQSLVLLLDSVQDPQNLGTILRSAECFAVDAVIWSRNRGVGLTPAGRKASVGASELVDQVEVSNLVDAIKKLKDGGFWVVAAEAREGSVDIDSFDFPQKTALIAGSEGEGIRQLASKNSDFRVKIPIFGKIDSLNVSQAAAVLLHSYRRQHKPVLR